MNAEARLAEQLEIQALLFEGAVVSGSKSALDGLGANEDVEDLIRPLVGGVVACIGLRWPDGPTLEAIAEFARKPGIYESESPSVSPMITEAVIRVATGDQRFMIGLNPLVLAEHLAVALRLLVQELGQHGIDIDEIRRTAARLCLESIHSTKGNEEQ